MRSPDQAADPRGGEATAPDPARPFVDRGGDRRTRPTPRVSRWSFGGGRRRRARREEERDGSFVDLYPSRLWFLILWVALMNVADTYFTLFHLQQGGVELNPVADAMLTTGRFGFVAIKAALIGGALVVLCLHKNFLVARIGLVVAAAAYTALVLYHLSLFRVG